MEDVVVVGGGPSGSYIGGKLAQKGYKVKVLEEHSEIGRPMCCAGILGSEEIKELGLDPREWALNSLKGGKFHFPSNRSVFLSRDRIEAYVIDRAKFDQDLSRKAIESGAELKLGCRCNAISVRDDHVELKVEGENGTSYIKSRIVVGADGTNSTVARNCGLISRFSPLICAQAEVVGGPKNELVNVYLDNELSRSFFGYVVPAGNFYRVGLCDKEGNIRGKLLDFLKKISFFPDNPGRKVVSLTTDLIPEPNSRKIYGERVLLVGDAAGHVKPMTGGGLYIGISCAKIASEVLEKALESVPSEKTLEMYGDLVKKKFGKEFELGLKARSLMERMNNEDLSDLSELLEIQEVQKFISENFDFDRHSDFFEALIKKGPKLVNSIGIGKTFKFLRWFAYL